MIGYSTISFIILILYVKFFYPTILREK